MSDIVNISDFQSLVAEEMSLEALKQQMLTLRVINNRLAAENIALKEQLGNKFLMPSSEELICIEQIDLLKRASELRELSLDEVKRLDLLIKNAKILKESRNKEKEIDIDSISEEDLVAIATNHSTN
jgi:hypothetical protein